MKKKSFLKKKKKSFKAIIWLTFKDQWPSMGHGISSTQWFKFQKKNAVTLLVVVPPSNDLLKWQYVTYEEKENFSNS